MCPLFLFKWKVGAPAPNEPMGFAEAFSQMMPQNAHPSHVHSQNREFDIKSTGSGPGTSGISIII